MENKEYYPLEELQIKEDSPIWKSVKGFAERWPEVEPQVGVMLGKRYLVTTLKDYFEKFGDITKVRYSKRRGFRGKLKDGRRIRLW
jgi:hypothetical protein